MAKEQRDDRFTAMEERYADYTVYDKHYEKIGKVDDLFVDENDRPEYVGVKMGLLGTRSTLIPIDIVRVNDKRRLVEVAAEKEAVENGPTFDDDSEITAEFERQVLAYYRVETSSASAQRGTYGAYYSDAVGDERVDLQPGERAEAREHSGEERPSAAPGEADHEREELREHEELRERGDLTDEEELRVQRSEEELRAGTRERRAGSVNVRKRVRTDHERLSVPKRREEVSVERVRVEDRQASEAEIGEDDEVRIPVVEEEVVVEKRPVVKEEIRLRKDVVEEEEVVEEDVRKEEVDIEDRIERGEGSRRAKTVDQETADRLPQEARDETSLEDGGKADREARRQESSSKKDEQRAVSADDTKEDQESLPVAEYNDLTVDEAKKRLGALSEGELKKLRIYEKKHKNRKTLVRWLDRKLKKAH